MKPGAAAVTRFGRGGDEPDFKSKLLEKRNLARNLELQKQAKKASKGKGELSLYKEGWLLKRKGGKL